MLFGLVLIVAGVVVVPYVVPQHGASQLNTQAEVSNPYQTGAATVSAVDQLGIPGFPLADLYVNGQKVGQLLGYAEQSIF